MLAALRPPPGPSATDHVTGYRPLDQKSGRPATVNFWGTEDFPLDEEAEALMERVVERSEGLLAWATWEQIEQAEWVNGLPFGWNAVNASRKFINMTREEREKVASNYVSAGAAQQGFRFDGWPGDLNGKVRVSASMRAAIRTRDGRYLMIRYGGNPDRRNNIPVGGHLHGRAPQGGRIFLQERFNASGFRGEGADVNDIDMDIPVEKLEEFAEWFATGEDRELSVFREMWEELVLETGAMTPWEFARVFVLSQAHPPAEQGHAMERAKKGVVLYNAFWPLMGIVLLIAVLVTINAASNPVPPVDWAPFVKNALYVVGGASAIIFVIYFAFQLIGALFHGAAFLVSKGFEFVVGLLVPVTIGVIVGLFGAWLLGLDLWGAALIALIGLVGWFAVANRQSMDRRLWVVIPLVLMAVFFVFKGITWGGILGIVLGVAGLCLWMFGKGNLQRIGPWMAVAGLLLAGYSCFQILNTPSPHVSLPLHLAGWPGNAVSVAPGKAAPALATLVLPLPTALLRRLQEAVRGLSTPFSARRASTRGSIDALKGQLATLKEEEDALRLRLSVIIPADPLDFSPGSLSLVEELEDRQAADFARLLAVQSAIASLRHALQSLEELQAPAAVRTALVNEGGVAERLTLDQLPETSLPNVSIVVTDATGWNPAQGTASLEALRAVTNDKAVSVFIVRDAAAAAAMTWAKAPNAYVRTLAWARDKDALVSDKGQERIAVAAALKNIVAEEKLMLSDDSAALGLLGDGPSQAPLFLEDGDSFTFIEGIVAAKGKARIVSKRVFLVLLEAALHHWFLLQRMIDAMA